MESNDNTIDPTDQKQEETIGELYARGYKLRKRGIRLFVLGTAMVATGVTWLIIENNRTKES
jgi:hypothetical protein